MSRFSDSSDDAAAEYYQAQNLLKQGAKAEQQLTTFSDEGRKIIKGYWDAQAVISETLSASMSRTDDLIEGKITLDDLYNEDGTARKVGR